MLVNRYSCEGSVGSGRFKLPHDFWIGIKEARLEDNYIYIYNIYSSTL